MKINGYKFGNKNNWRRWVWNRVCEKYKRSKKDAIIVYLAGIEDLDRKIAVDRGFKPYNMIAIDRSEDVVKALREKGALAIHGELFETLKGFSGTNCRIDILIADICCGVTDSVYEFAKYMTDDVTANIFKDYGEEDYDDDEEVTLEGDDIKDPVVMFNFMRGRDNGIILDSLKEKGFKHRGEMLIETMCQIRKKHEVSLFTKHAKEENRGLNEMEIRIIDESLENSRACYVPDYRSYKSGNITMDSVVFNYLHPPITCCSKVSNECTKKVSATLAIRTMKMNGQLKACPLE